MEVDMREMREAAVVVRPYTLAEEPLGERDRVHVLRAVAINIPGLEAPFVERISTGLTTENIPVRNYADLVCLCAKREEAFVSNEHFFSSIMSFAQILFERGL
jgi:hypothetical protein